MKIMEVQKITSTKMILVSEYEVIKDGIIYRYRDEVSFKNSKIKKTVSKLVFETVFNKITEFFAININYKSVFNHALSTIAKP